MGEATAAKWLAIHEDLLKTTLTVEEFAKSRGATARSLERSLRRLKRDGYDVRAVVIVDGQFVVGAHSDKANRCKQYVKAIAKSQSILMATGILGVTRHSFIKFCQRNDIAFKHLLPAKTAAPTAAKIEKHVKAASERRAVEVEKAKVESKNPYEREYGTLYTSVTVSDVLGVSVAIVDACRWQMGLPMLMTVVQRDALNSVIAKTMDISLPGWPQMNSEQSVSPSS